MPNGECSWLSVEYSEVSEANKKSNHEDLEVWQLGIRIVKAVYLLTDSFPEKEKYRLTDQMCRAAISIPSNIAEGGARKSTKEFMRFLTIAIGSLAEIRTQYHISKELGYSSNFHHEEFAELLALVGKKLHALYHSLEKKR